MKGRQTRMRTASRRWRPTLLVLLVALVTVAACARSSEDPNPAGSGASAPGESANGSATGAPSGRPTELSRTPLPTLKPPTEPPKSPTDNFKSVTATGVVRLSGGCKQLVTDGITWALIGTVVTEFKDGDRIEVIGLPAPQLDMTCAGSPLRVQSARRV